MAQQRKESDCTQQTDKNDEQSSLKSSPEQQMVQDGGDNTSPSAPPQEQKQEGTTVRDKDTSDTQDAELQKQPASRPTNPRSKNPPPPPTYPPGLHPISGPDMRRKLVIMDRSGGGYISHVPVDVDAACLEWKKIRVIKSEEIRGLRDFCIAAAGNFLYIIGGMLVDERRIVSKVKRYDPVEDEWEAMKPMSTARSGCCVAVLDKNILVIGGEKSDGKATASCELYDTETGGWRRAGMMPAARRGHACTHTDRLVYTSGGLHAKHAHTNLWVYENHKWKEIDEYYPHEIHRALEEHMMIRVRNTIYFIGGISHTLQQPHKNPHGAAHPHPERYTTRVEASVESFKPTVSAADRKQRADLICPWSRDLPKLHYSRARAAAVALDQCIYVIGGEGSSPGSVLDVEMLDTAAAGGEWSIVNTLPKANFKNVAVAYLDFPKHKKKIQLEEEQVEVEQAEPDEPLLDEIREGKWVMW